MFGITDIAAGWLRLTLYSGFKSKSFYVSYLSDFINEMNYLLDVTMADTDVRRIMLDGEGQELYLTAWVEQYKDKLHLVWEEYDKKGNLKSKMYVFNRTKFINHFNRIFKNIEKQYYESFDWETYADRMDKEMEENGQ